ncbi:MAG: nitroreductase family protein [Candidatus Omnitrophica bacterium]|nr:nitroreductase family protein [Candidatus Omnitrophota bacterium]
MNNALDVLFNRKSTRQYTGKPVSVEDLTTLIRAGMAAPCSRGQKCWYFIAVNDQAVIAKLAAGLPYAQMILSAKHAIVVLADLNLAHGGAEVPYWIQDLSAAAENILIAAEARGLGACWTGVHPRPERVEFLCQALDLPPQVMPLCVIAIGQSAGVEKARDKFDPTRIFWNHWKQK